MLAELMPGLAGFENIQQEYRARPSMAGPERCIRQMVYHASKTPRDKRMGDRFVLVLDDSSWQEHLTADWIRKSAFKVHSQQMEVSVECYGRFMKGNIDWICTDILGRDWLVDHKAINHFTYQRYEGGQLPLDYITQCCIYLRGLQNVIPDIGGAAILIKNKNTAQFLEFLLNYDHEKDSCVVLEMNFSNAPKRTLNVEIRDVVGSAFKKFSEVDVHVAAKTLPDRPFDYGTKFPCGYCAWSETCWANYEAEFQGLTDNAELEGEIVELCRYYLEESGHETGAKKNKGLLKDKIKHILALANTRGGKAGEYVIMQSLKEGERLMTREEILPHLLPLLTKKVLNERFTIRKIKQEGNGNGDF